ncbi:hypothetical protein CHGG_02480 [Chaetomium globosum CBS 148.51]|uniref:Putative phospholipase n=1 Tax=Chaetomium globosum (strain ATCC 6205 / CBS 148.51 / DSM 1962 / NBRC 6347 / NRRL 1970) TaxID=306901 RepID=Q2HBC4_CHAGB|nr:uncharacterized protein CHGG_02480 [Chaetomium globosum CBS 148.51]EAQ90545.1 hypothetical protein CHGG_02480 [Chaetomium globosum CBS 148.51]
MASFVSSLSPVPAFPEYQGPYKVGTVDVEIPVSELESPSSVPDGSSHIHTILFRIFYPAVPESQGKRVSWLPAPQRLHIAAYAHHTHGLLSESSFLPRHLHWTSIPAHKNATLLPPPSDRPTARWPTMLFSHGLGGNRNAYSHLAGSLASHGVVVVCPEHRDGSAALTLVRDPQSRAPQTTQHAVPYLRIAHTQTPDAWSARTKQLRVRLWELGLLFEALTALDRGAATTPSSQPKLINLTTAPPSALAQFAHALDIHTPGRVLFAGHSFGAATIRHRAPGGGRGGESVVVAGGAGGAGGGVARVFQVDGAFACEGEDFVAKAGGEGGGHWGGVSEGWKSGWGGGGRMGRRVGRGARGPGARPHFFYVESSAHLSQSDFGVLFPWLTKRVFKSDNPERVLRLNVRAVLQFLRENGVPVAGTGRAALVDGGHPGMKGEWTEKDGIILERCKEGEEKVDAWKWIDVVGLGAKAGPSELEIREKGKEEREVKAEEGEKEMQGEIEPSLESVAEGAAVHATKELVGTEK